MCIGNSCPGKAAITGCLMQRRVAPAIPGMAIKQAIFGEKKSAFNQVLTKTGKPDLKIIN
jgi:hypothetical protein